MIGAAALAYFDAHKALDIDAEARLFTTTRMPVWSSLSGPQLNECERD